VTRHLSHVKLMTQEEQAELIRQLQMQAAQQQAQATQAAQPEMAVAGGDDAPEGDIDYSKVVLTPEQMAKTGRNDLCPCGSGKKFKHCHGRI
ncbi:MAG: SEC-C metal-binding domain-containing protein, partial [Pseudomonadota bacterium]